MYEGNTYIARTVSVRAMCYICCVIFDLLCYRAHDYLLKEQRFMTLSLE